MRLRIALDDKVFDLRLRDRLLAEGKVTQEQLDQYLKAIKDEEKNAHFVNNEKKGQK